MRLQPMPARKDERCDDPAATRPEIEQGQGIEGRCVGVTDGDTIKVLSAGNELIRVRLAFISNSLLSRAIQPSVFRCSEAHRKHLHRCAPEATTHKEHVQDNLLVRRPFSRSPILKFFASAIDPSLNWFEVEHQPTWS
jgi:hypothetical protein